MGAVPKMPLAVDERDRRARRMSIEKKVGRRPASGAPKLAITEEKKGSELLRHPGDVVAAAITLQRFFRRLQVQRQARKSLAKRARRKKRGQVSSSSEEEEEERSSATESESKSR